MVFQHFNLFANMTALQNVAYAPRVVNGLSRADAEAKAQKLLEKVGLGDKSDQYPSRLSGGQKQRVAIARAWPWNRKCCFWTNLPPHSTRKW